MTARTQCGVDEDRLGSVRVTAGQCRGEQLDARSDLFSLGVVLYEMATRQVPFQGIGVFSANIACQ